MFDLDYFRATVNALLFSHYPGLEIIVVSCGGHRDDVSAELFDRVTKKCPRLHTIAVSTKQEHVHLSEMVKDLQQLRVIHDEKYVTYDLFAMPI